MQERQKILSKLNAVDCRRDTSLGESDFDEKSLTQVVKQSAVTLKNIFMNSFCCFFCMTTSKRDCSCAFKSIFAGSLADANENLEAVPKKSSICWNWEFTLKAG